MKRRAENRRRGAREEERGEEGTKEDEDFVQGSAFRPGRRGRDCPLA